jgi:hypothetical protein
METTSEIPIIITEVSEYEKFRKPIQDIITFIETIDEKYREKCFEVLLNHYLLNGTVAKVGFSRAEANRNKLFVPEDLAVNLKSFLEQNNISEETLKKLFIKEKNEIKPIYKINEKAKAKAQVQIALLTALESALKTASGSFEFVINTVRQRCMDNGVYDGREFFINFLNTAGLYQSLNHEVVKLTPTGEMELVKVIGIVLKQ